MRPASKSVEVSLLLKKGKENFEIKSSDLLFWHDVASTNFVTHYRELSQVMDS